MEAGAGRLIVLMAGMFLAGCLGYLLYLDIRRWRRVSPGRLLMEAGLILIVFGGVQGFPGMQGAGWWTLLSGGAVLALVPRWRRSSAGGAVPEGSAGREVPESSAGRSEETAGRSVPRDSAGGTVPEGSAGRSLSGRHGLLLAAGGILVLAVFVGITFAMNHLRLRQLPPALQSAWFAPHIAAYMLGYTMMALATVLAIAEALRVKTAGADKEPGGAAGADKGQLQAAGGESDQKTLRSSGAVWSFGFGRRLLTLGFALLTMGLSMGALWASTAWGNYWSWDPKETWALLSWLAYAMILLLDRRFATGRSATPAGEFAEASDDSAVPAKGQVSADPAAGHYSAAPTASGIWQRLRPWLLVAAFLLLQMCWWGASLLSNAPSLHAY